MSTVTFPDGMIMNLETGEILGAEPKATTAADVLKKTGSVDVERPAGEGGGFMDALNQFSWGFNSALFALPDAVVKQVGRAAGVKEEEIPQMVEYFNRGEVAPEGQLERAQMEAARAAKLSAGYGWTKQHQEACAV
jgi:hypothetical protein